MSAYETMSKSELAAKVVASAPRYLECKGYRILERLDASDCVHVVAESPEGVIVFAAVSAALGKSPCADDCFADMQAARTWAAEWLLANGRSNQASGIRFDVLAFTVGRNGRAMVRHCLGVVLREAAAV